jgi:hypothetical protein
MGEEVPPPSPTYNVIPGLVPGTHRAARDGVRCEPGEGIAARHPTKRHPREGGDPASFRKSAAPYGLTQIAH